MHTHRNAKDSVSCVLNKLLEVQSVLNMALDTVEKSYNKDNIEDILNSVNQALKNTNTTLNNYQESW